MARVHVTEKAFFECPNCGEESETDPMTMDGKSVVCEYCGASHRVASVSHPVDDWNSRNRAKVKRRQLGAEGIT